MESITNGGLWEVGFGKTPLCIHFSVILKQCITAMIKKTNKNWGQAMVNLHSSYNRLYPLVINPHHACSHWLTLLPRLTVVNDRFQNINDSLESGPDGAGWGEWKWGKCGETSQWGITSQNCSGLWRAHKPCTRKRKSVQHLDKPCLVSTPAP